LDEVCAPGYLGRKRGEVVRPRTTVLQAHTSEWMGTFGERGNGDYRGVLLRAASVVAKYQTHLQFALDRALVRLDGLYGNGAIAQDLDAVGLNYVMRGKDYDLLDLPEIQARLALPPDQQTTHPRSGNPACPLRFSCGPPHANRPQKSGHRCHTPGPGCSSPHWRHT
jgi:hypothetical protein